MKNIFIHIAIILVILASVAHQSNAAQESIVAVVNDSVITATDIKERVKLYISSTESEPTTEQKKSIKTQVLDRLINETIQLQEAQKLGINVSKDEISAGFNRLAEQNNVTPEKLKTDLESKGVNVNSLYDQIQAEIAWSHVIRRELSPKINISDTEIDAALAQLEQDYSKTQYLVAEIFLKLEKGLNNEEVKNKMTELLQELQNGAPFSALAKNFSQAPGAANGGDLGWVQDGQLPKELNLALENLKPGQISMPIRSDNGYHLLYLRDIKQKMDEKSLSSGLNKEDANSRNNIANQLGTKRLMRMADHYMSDLRATAFIEKRI